MVSSIIKFFTGKEITTYPKNLPRLVLVNRAIIYNSKKQILLIKRSDKEKFDKGKWELPGGKLEHDTLISDNLIKEVKEETGLDVKVISNTKYIIQKDLRGEPGIYNNFVMLDLIEETISLNKKQEIRLGSEHTEYRWVDLQNFKNQEILTKTTKLLLSKMNNTAKLLIN